MEKEKKPYRAHCLIVPYPRQGHINPMLQFGKRLDHKGVKFTLVTTRFISESIAHKASSSSIPLETISDGFDEGGSKQAKTRQDYFDTFRKVGSETLFDLIEKLNAAGVPVDCVIYDALMPWCLDVAHKFGLLGAVFFTQSCAVDSIYFHHCKGLVKLPVDEETEILLPVLPPLTPKDLPSFMYNNGSFPGALDVLKQQFRNIDEVDWVLCNTFSELELEIVGWLAKIWPLKTIGPTIPSMYLDKQLKEDTDYGFSIFKPDNEACIRWLNDKPKDSVVYVSFGSMATLGEEQMEEICWGLKRSNSYFLWVVRATEEAKLPKEFTVETNSQGLIVNWSPQLEVLAHEAVGCFVTHCGWNSTLEAMSLGVPMVAMPQWSDQTTNSKFVQDVWKMGLIAEVDEGGIVRQQVLEHCIREIKEGERGKEIKLNAEKWRNLAKLAMHKGGSSDKNIDEFVASFARPN